MHNVCLTPEAVRDLAELKQYISVELKNPTAAKKTLQTITGELRTLARFPESGPSIEALTGYPTELRFFICGKHLALYRIEEKTVSIARIVDPRQDYLRILFGDTYWEQTDLQNEKREE